MRDLKGCGDRYRMEVARAKVGGKK